MGATECPGSVFRGSVALAACALPGVVPSAAFAVSAPTQGVVSLRYAAYAESQPVDEGARTSGTPADRVSQASGGPAPATDGRRIRVVSPSLYLLLPMGSRWSTEATFTHDTVSGASPLYYAEMSAAQQMKDVRRAADFKLTRWYERSSLSVMVAKSVESDYVSNAWSVSGTRSSDGQNVTLNAGAGRTEDRLDANNGLVSGEGRRKTEAEVGVSCTCTSDDYLHLNVQYSQSRGYLSDPYKLFDWRPGEREARVTTLRWNHWLGASALRTSYRSYRDTFGVRSRTFELGWMVPAEDGWTLTPAVRFYSQSAASFFKGPSSDGYPTPPPRPAFHSADQRLSAFGAVTAGLKVGWEFARGWQVEGQYDRYRQRSDWALPKHANDLKLPRLDATVWQLGLTHRF